MMYLADSPNNNDLLTICCVLKSGGDYFPLYVSKLREQIRNVMTVPFRFVCLTDMELENEDVDIPLFYNYSGWWSKLEIFRLKGPTIYFDLDTIIIKEFENDFNWLFSSEKFYMMECFNPNRKFASGIMAWNGDFSFILDEYKGKADIKDWDQFYIINKVGVENINFLPFQKGIFSYKYHCRPELRDDAKIVCFHGKPRPHEVRRFWPTEYWGIL